MSQMETTPTVTELHLLDAYWRAARDQAYVHHHGEARGGSRCIDTARRGSRLIVDE